MYRIIIEDKNLNTKFISQYIYSKEEINNKYNIMHNEYLNLFPDYSFLSKENLDGLLKNLYIVGYEQINIIDNID